MSVQIMDLVWRRSEHKGSDLLVLLAIADNADEESGIAYPGIDYLAAKTRLSSRGVQYAVKRLLESDELELLERGGRKGGKAKANTYRVQTQSLREKAPKTQTATSQHATPCTPTVSREPSVEEEHQSSSSQPPCSTSCREVWDYYLGLFPSPRGKGLTASRVRVIEKALAEFHVEELKRALDGGKRWREKKPGGTEISDFLATNPRTGPLAERIGFFIQQGEAARSDEIDDLDADQVRREQGLD